MTTTSTQLRIGPAQTPRPIRLLIMITCVISIVAALLDPLFLRVFQLPSPQMLLSLSWPGIQRFFLWQPITHLFIHGAGGTGVTFGLLITLALNMFMLWIFGSTVIERIGTGPFMRLYLLSGVFAGLVTLIVMANFASYAVLFGASPCIFALFVVWVMLNPQAEVLLFFVFPVKAKWLLAGVVGAVLLVNLSQGNLVGATHTLAPLFFAYGYALLAWDLRSPYPSAHYLEGRIAATWQLWGQRKQSHSKIIDFETGKPIDDDETFMDAMLEKIAEKGEQALTRRERKRMDQVADRLSRKNSRIR